MLQDVGIDPSGPERLVTCQTMFTRMPSFVRQRVYDISARLRFIQYTFLCTRANSHTDLHQMAEFAIFRRPGIARRRLAVTRITLKQCRRSEGIWEHLPVELRVSGRGNWHFPFSTDRWCVIGELWGLSGRDMFCKLGRSLLKLINSLVCSRWLYASDIWWIIGRLGHQTFKSATWKIPTGDS